MATVTETDLKEITDLLNNQFKEINAKIDKVNENFDKKIDKLSEGINSLKLDLAHLQGELTGINKRL